MGGEAADAVASFKLAVLSRALGAVGHDDGDEVIGGSADADDN